MKMRKYMMLAVVAGMALGASAQQSFVLGKIHERLLTAGYDEETADKIVDNLSKQEPEVADIFAQYLDDLRGEERKSARYRNPDFKSAASLMIKRFRDAVGKCEKEGIEYKTNGNPYGVFNTGHIADVLDVVDMMNIDGFKADTLANLKMPLTKFAPLRDALAFNYDYTGKSEPNIAQVADALERAYEEFGKRVRKRYSVTEDGKAVTAAVYDVRQSMSQQPRLKVTFDAGRVTGIEGITLPFSLKAPADKIGDIDFKYLNYSRRWLNVIDDKQLWDVLYQPQRWTLGMHAGTLSQMASDGVYAAGYDLDCLAARKLRNGPANALFAMWYLPYAGINVGDGTVDNSRMRLYTSAGSYEIDADGRLPQAEEASLKVYDLIVQDLQDLRERVQEEERLYAEQSFVEVLGLDILNTDENLRPVSPAGTPLHASEVRFIAPQLKIRSLTSIPRNVVLFFSIYDTRGKLCSMPFSPKGYTGFEKFDLNPDEDTVGMPGWGDADKGVFRPGTYRIDIHSKSGKKLYSTTFKIL